MCGKDDEIGKMDFWHLDQIEWQVCSIIIRIEIYFSKVSCNDLMMYYDSNPIALQAFLTRDLSATKLNWCDNFPHHCISFIHSFITFLIRCWRFCSFSVFIIILSFLLLSLLFNSVVRSFVEGFWKNIVYFFIFWKTDVTNK